MPAQSLSPSAENRGLKAKGGCHSGQSRLSRGKRKKKVWGWGESKLAVVGVPGCSSPGSRGVGFNKEMRGRAKGTTGQHESGEKYHILLPSSLPELRGLSSWAGPGCVRVSARARHPCCCLQRLHAGVQEGMPRALAAPLCTHCQTSLGSWWKGPQTCNHAHHLPVPDALQVLGLGARLLPLPTPLFSQINLILRNIYEGNREIFFSLSNEPAGPGMGRLRS